MWVSKLMESVLMATDLTRLMDILTSRGEDNLMLVHARHKLAVMLG